MGVTGQLLEMRVQGDELARKLQLEFGRGKSNMASVVRSAFAKASAQMTAALVSDLASYDNFLQELKGYNQEALCGWTLSSAKGQLEKLRQLGEKIATRKTKLAEHLEGLRQGQLQYRKDSFDARLREARRFHKATHLWKKDVPDSLLQYLFSKEALVCFASLPEEKDKDTPPAEESKDDDASSSTSSADHQLACNFKQLSQGDEDFNAGVPMLFTEPSAPLPPAPPSAPPSVPSSASPSGDASFSKLILGFPGLFGQQRLDGALQKLLESLKQQGTGQLHASLRLEPKGAGHDTVEQLGWIPPAWKTAGVIPEALRSFGAPWLLASSPGGFRCGFEKWPAPGLGQFLVSLQGDCILCVWPVQSVIDRGCDDRQLLTWPFTLPAAAFRKWADEAKLRYCQLVKGSAVWVPYGWHACLVARSSASCASLLIQPYINLNLASKCESWPAVAASLVNYLDKQMSSAESSFARRHGKEFREWLTTEASVLQRVSLSIMDQQKDAPAPLLNVPVATTSVGSASIDQNQLSKEAGKEY